MLQQQQQQQQQLLQNVANGAANRLQPGQTAQQPPSQTTQSPSSAGLGASALPAASAAPAATSTAAPSQPAAVSASHFTQQQLNLLRQQIHAFRLLGKNVGVPLQMQQAIFAQRLRRQASAVEKLAQVASTPTEQTTPAQDPSKTGASGADANAEEDIALAAPEKVLKRVKLPWEAGVIRKSINYFDHKSRRNRPFIPAVLPTGVDFEQLRADREKIVFNRMSARYAGRHLEAQSHY